MQKITCLRDWLVFGFFISALGVNAQSVENCASHSFTMRKSNAGLEDMLLTIEKKSDYSFFYHSDVPEKAKPIRISVKNVTLDSVLKVCVTGQPFTYKIMGRVIIFKPDSNFHKAPLIRKSESKDKFSTGSISSISGNEINQLGSGDIFSNSVVNGLQTSRDKQGNTSMLIRGKNSIAAGTEPLVLLDGMPYTGGIDRLDRSNIEDIKVLKDGDATAIYGSRGGNGVILITSKKAGLVNLPLNDNGPIELKGGFVVYRRSSAWNILDDISRRYKVDAAVEGRVLQGAFTGRLRSTIPLEQAIDLLRAVGAIGD